MYGRAAEIHVVAIAISASEPIDRRRRPTLKQSPGARRQRRPIGVSLADHPFTGLVERDKPPTARAELSSS
jgi:hypothetical protein